MHPVVRCTEPLWVTHPFHPLFGQEFELFESRLIGGRSGCTFLDREGRIQSILANCTDVGGVDPFVELPRGRAFFGLRRPAPFG